MRNIDTTFDAKPVENPVANQPGERRGAPRLRLMEEHGIVNARIRPGTDATVIDASAGGLLVETVHRLLPGTPIELQLTTAGSRVAIRGTVVRCAVARLRASGIWYRGAIAFDRHLPWTLPADAHGYARKEREDATPRI